MWHGCVWSDQKILSKPPRQVDRLDSVERRERSGEAPARDWRWQGDAPDVWNPTFEDTGSNRRVKLHYFDPVGGERIYRATDTYAANGYDAETENTLLCSGGPGFIY